MSQVCVSMNSSQSLSHASNSISNKPSRTLIIRRTRTCLPQSSNSKRVPRNGKWVSRRNCVPAKSEEAVSASSSGTNSSTSLLSFLCPLLKLFSVSLSFIPVSSILFSFCLFNLIEWIADRRSFGGTQLHCGGVIYSLFFFFFWKFRVFEFNTDIIDLRFTVRYWLRHCRR